MRFALGVLLVVGLYFTLTAAAHHSHGQYALRHLRTFKVSSKR